MSIPTSCEKKRIQNKHSKLKENGKEEVRVIGSCYNSMKTSKFRTRQEFIKRFTHPKSKREYVIGLDAGYSSMKCFYENGYFCFPSYAKRINESDLLLTGEKDILYRDNESGELYMIGYTAQDMIESTDTNDTESEFFSRKRYGSKVFRILCNAAVGIALLNRKDDREIFIQTGLPSSYDADKGDIIRAISTPTKFDLKVGEGAWNSYDLKIKKENIAVMPQPAGALYSFLITSEGKYIPNAKKYMMSNLLVMDIGFGTFDFYGLKSHSIACRESINEIGMRSVLKRTVRKILDDTNEEIRIQALQKNLESGSFIVLDEEEMKTENKDLSPFLEQASEEVFREAMERAKNVTSAFRDYNYIIVDGGTGEAWFEKIKQYLSGMKNITVFPCNSNDALPFIYANARGYYMYHYVLTR